MQEVPALCSTVARIGATVDRSPNGVILAFEYFCSWRRPKRVHLIRIVVFVSLILTPALVCAQNDARQAPLVGFSTAEITRVEPLLDDGIVGLVELPQGDRVPAVHLAALVHAPAHALRDLLARPEQYPSFMPAVSEVSVHDRHGDVVGFTWRFRTSVFSLGGNAMLTLLSPRPGQEARGYRMVIERTGGDFGQGREVWRIVPRGASQSLVLVSARMDLRDANYITRQLSRSSLSLSRSITLATAFGSLSRTRLEAERRAAFVRPVRRAQLSRPAIDLVGVAPLLARGDLFVVELNGPDLVQASVASQYAHAEDHVRRIMLDPVAFTEALITGSSARVRVQSGDGVHFDWSVDLPLIGTGGAMRLVEAEDRVIHLDATSGAFAGGRWRFATQALGPASTGVIGWASFDVADANFLLRAIVDADAALRPGLSAATEIMMSRALRIRLSR